MTEEQFWHSNPRIIKTWEKAYKQKMNAINEYVYLWVGNYGISALQVAIDHCFNGRKAKSKYIEKPFQIFALTEEEKKLEAMKAREAFVSWANMAEKKYAKKGEKNG